ncbi:MAG TPA: hypothetical protein VK558_11495 [Patescibacteria group bacterium]|nr:hypothetical protein [Patescibacteria group bacterium]
MRQVLIACLAASMLGACTGLATSTPTPTPAVGFLLLDGVSIINTKKTIDDHVVSWVTGQDCSTVRASRGEAYCEETPKPGPMVVQNSYCYKSLGSVTCYTQPVATDAARLYGVRTEDVPVNAPH